MPVVLTLVQTKQIRINVHKRNNTNNKVQTIQKTVNTQILPKHPHITKPMRTHTDTLQTPHIHIPTHYKTHTYTPTHYKTSYNNHSTRHTPNKTVTIQSSTLTIKSHYCTWYFCPQELHRNSRHATSLPNKITMHRIFHCKGPM